MKSVKFKSKISRTKVMGMQKILRGLGRKTYSELELEAEYARVSEIRNPKDLSLLCEEAKNAHDSKKSELKKPFKFT